MIAAQLDLRPAIWTAHREAIDIVQWNSLPTAGMIRLINDEEDESTSSSRSESTEEERVSRDIGTNKAVMDKVDYFNILACCDPRGNSSRADLGDINAAI